MKKSLAIFFIFVIVVAAAAPVFAAPNNVGFGNLYYNGKVVRTVVPPAAMPKSGQDNLYVITNGTSSQLPVAAVGPGDANYHGGQWAFHEVIWNELNATYDLTSEADVLDAESQGLVTIVRVEDNDFKCPIQP
jgi:hypothetical protein